MKRNPLKSAALILSAELEKKSEFPGALLPQLVVQGGKISDLLFPCQQHAIAFVGFGLREEHKGVPKGPGSLPSLPAEQWPGRLLSLARVALPHVFSLEITFGLLLL